jgi:hypothetical protein
VFTSGERQFAVLSLLEPGVVNSQVECEVSFSLASCKRTATSLSALAWSELLFKDSPANATIGRHTLFGIRLEWNFLDLEI